MICRTVLATALSLAFTALPADAKGRPAIHPDCNITMPCDLRNYVQPSKREQARRDRGRRIERAMPFGKATQKKPAAKVAAKRAAKSAPTIAGYVQQTVKSAGVSLAGVVPELAAKAREIQEACGSKVISAVRRTFIRGTRRMSLHATGQAVDMAGNPECMYGLLKGWGGGYSTDYARVKHVHISHSDGGREWGARFAHGRRAARRTRYAAAN